MLLLKRKPDAGVLAQKNSPHKLFIQEDFYEFLKVLALCDDRPQHFVCVFAVARLIRESTDRTIDDL